MGLRGVAAAAAVGVIVLAIAGPVHATPPTNDNVAQAQVLTTVHTAGTNTGATLEPGEPEHAGNDRGASVWYQWTAPSSVAVAVDTSGSDFDTLLAVYIPSDPNSSAAPSVSEFQPLSQHIAYNDDATVGGDGTSRACFTAAAGFHYFIAVDGYGGDTGNVSLNIAPKADSAPCPVRPPLTTNSHAARRRHWLDAGGGVWVDEDDAHATHQWYRCQAELSRSDRRAGADGLHRHLARRRHHAAHRRVQGGSVSASDPTPTVAMTPGDARRQRSPLLDVQPRQPLALRDLLDAPRRDEPAASDL